MPCGRFSGQFCQTGWERKQCTREIEIAPLTVLADPERVGKVLQEKDFLMRVSDPYEQNHCTRC
jgi:hypothetical protein